VVVAPQGGLKGEQGNGPFRQVRRRRAIADEKRDAPNEGTHGTLIV